MNPAYERLLAAMQGGQLDGRKIPNGSASDSMQFAILDLAAQGFIEPAKLLEIYPSMPRLRKHIVATMEELRVTKRDEEASALNDFFILKLCALPGGDE